MVPPRWIINSLNMYKTSDEVINFIEKTMENRRVELTAGGRSLAEIQRGIFQRDALSSLLFVKVMVPFNDILRKCTGSYKLSKSQEKTIHQMYMDEIKLQKRKGKGNPNPDNENIPSVYRDGIWHRKVHHSSNEKLGTTDVR